MIGGRLAVCVPAGGATGAIAWRHAAHALVCDEIGPWEHGTVVGASGMRDYWDYNAVRVEGGDPGIGAMALMRRADELQEGLPHRRVEVEDEPAGARLRPAFAAAGWVVERLAWMRREGAPPAGDEAVMETSVADARELRAAWHLGGDGGGDEAAVERFLAMEDAVAARRGSRAFVVREGGGNVAFATLWAPEGERAAEVEQVFVLPERRGHGLGRRLIVTALAAAGRDLAWIVADDEDRPRRLYERLGFRTTWIQHAFVRRPQPSRRPPA